MKAELVKDEFTITEDEQSKFHFTYFAPILIDGKSRLCAYGYANSYEDAKQNARELAGKVTHAINHVDALVDALEFLLSLSRGTSGRIIIEKSEESAALEALNAYRGTK